MEKDAAKLIKPKYRARIKDLHEIELDLWLKDFALDDFISTVKLTENYPDKGFETNLYNKNWKIGEAIEFQWRRSYSSLFRIRKIDHEKKTLFVSVMTREEFKKWQLEIKEKEEID